MSVQYKGGKKFDTWEDWVEYHDELHRQMHESIEKMVLPAVGTFVRDQIELLKKRITELETAEKEFRYCGVWAHGKYHRSNFVTHGGSLWHCNFDTDRMPGKDPQAWTMCVKHGKDGRDRDAA